MALKVQIVGRLQRRQSYLRPLALRPAAVRELTLEFTSGLADAVLRNDPLNLGALEIAAQAYSEGGLHPRALEIDLKLVALCPDNAICHYNLACTYSQLGRIDDSLDELTTAALLGYRDWKHMEKDPDLAAARKDHRYGSLLRRLRSGPPE